MVCKMVLDSLRYWVNECHVDGFRFDLAVALGRGQNDDYDPNHPFLVALRTDPVLSRVKLIAEPWDVGIHGWRTGQFPPPVRRVERPVPRLGAHLLARRPQGPGRRPPPGPRGARARHPDGRVAGPVRVPRPRTGRVGELRRRPRRLHHRDLTRYNSKHNGPNGEGNRDGSDNNRSWNHGVEGPDTGLADPEVEEVRRRSMRNLLGSTLLATGVPMLNAGDEFGRSQSGNNNPYCQDNATSWFAWELEPWQQDLLATTRFLTRLRADHPVLRQRTFFTGREVHEDGSTDLAWFDIEGEPMENGRWEDPSTRTLQMLLNGAWVGHASVLVVLHGSSDAGKVTLPAVPGLTAYQLLWDSTDERPGPPGDPTPPGPVEVGPTCIRVYRATDAT